MRRYPMLILHVGRRKRATREEYRRMQATQEWHCVEGYVTWFYRVSHSLMTPDAPGAPRPTYEEILENQQAEDDHATDLRSICQRIQMLLRDALDRSIIAHDSLEAVAVVERMIGDACGTTAYTRKRRSQDVRVRHT